MWYADSDIQGGILAYQVLFSDIILCKKYFAIIKMFQYRLCFDSSVPSLSEKTDEETKKLCASRLIHLRVIRDCRLFKDVYAICYMA